MCVCVFGVGGRFTLVEHLLCAKEAWCQRILLLLFSQLQPPEAIVFSSHTWGTVAWEGDVTGLRFQYNSSLFQSPCSFWVDLLL
jgi:hypothetical protein